MFEQHSTQHALSKIPEADRMELERACTWIVRSDFGYTLFGDKPCSTEGVANWSANFEEFGCWVELWRKHESLFQGRNFKLIVQPSLDDEMEVNFFNLPACVRTLDSHASAFRHFVGTSKPSDLLPIGRANYDLEWMEVPQLLGTMLGYGAENSLLFHIRRYLEDPEAPDIEENGLSWSAARKELGPILGYDSAQRALDAIEESLKSWRDGVWLDARIRTEPVLGYYYTMIPDDVELPGFRGVPEDPETGEITRRFLREREILREISANPNKLERVVAAIHR